MGISGILTMMQEAVCCFRIQNYHKGMHLFRECLSIIKEEGIIRDIVFGEDAFLQDMMAQMLDALEKGDMTLLADLLEEGFVPGLRAWIEPIQTQARNGYEIEITSSGYLTAKHMDTGLYLHTNGNPMEEARLWVEKCYAPQKGNYAVWGIGMGYHIRKLYELAKGSVNITVFEEDAGLIEIVTEQGLLKEIPSNRITIIEDRFGKYFANYISKEDMGILMHYPSVLKMENKDARAALQRFFANWNSGIQMSTEFAINFRSNQERCTHNVDELRGLFDDREVILVGAGPSLDRSMEYLKNNMGKRTIVAVSTVLRKLLAANIIPDCVVVMDAQSRTIGHIKGIEDVDVPMLIDSVAYWEFAEKYQGEKYIVYQEGYRDAQECAIKGGNTLYATGGSVITLALAIALKLGAKTIYFVGVDLAYPAGVSHATDTMDREKRDVSNMELVQAVHGGKVYADTLFVDYRKWIEKKMKEYPKVMFYNLSDCGAEIEGANVISVKEEL